MPTSAESGKTGTEIDYIGDELILFADAVNWKQYLAAALRPHLKGRVAEVGAGIGGTTLALIDAPKVTGWTAIEPDPGQYATLSATVPADRPVPVDFHLGTLEDLDDKARFDTILYIDVLEHIEDDRAEVRLAASRLAPGGRLVVLCPAWPFLYSPFDAAIGHYRRYTRGSLRKVAAPGLREVGAFYLDGVGLLASLVNKAMLRQAMPTKRQVALWDGMMVPVSRLVDPVMRHIAGKSIVLVWEPA